jgi:hypothetical protein
LKGNKNIPVAPIKEIPFTSLVLNCDSFKIELQTFILDDTLKEQWERYGFEYPFVTRQYLVFYKNEMEISQHLIPVEKTYRILKNGTKTSLSTMPIFDICLLKGSKGYIYYVYGANYCNGIDCPEFIGLYDMKGTVLSEKISNHAGLTRGSKVEEIEKRYGVNLIRRDTCTTILDYFIPYD